MLRNNELKEERVGGGEALSELCPVMFPRGRNTRGESSTVAHQVTSPGK